MSAELDDVVLTHLRTELTGEHDLSLAQGGGIIPGFTGEGTGGQDPQFVKLSEIIDTLNERFGTEFTEADKVFVDQIEQTCVENETLATSTASTPTVDVDEVVRDRRVGHHAGSTPNSRRSSARRRTKSSPRAV